MNMKKVLSAFMLILSFQGTAHGLPCPAGYPAAACANIARLTQCPYYFVIQYGSFIPTSDPQPINTTVASPYLPPGVKELVQYHSAQTGAFCSNQLKPEEAWLSFTIPKSPTSPQQQDFYVPKAEVCRMNRVHDALTDLIQAPNTARGFIAWSLASRTVATEIQPRGSLAPNERRRVAVLNPQARRGSEFLGYLDLFYNPQLTTANKWAIRVQAWTSNPSPQDAMLINMAKYWRENLPCLAGIQRVRVYRTLTR